VNTIYQSFVKPMTIHAAMGFGRSYGRESGFLGKKFSGISFAKIWDALDQDTTQSTIAFVTDVGNDLGYEQPVDAIVEWVETCVTRLNKRSAWTVLTGVPLDVLRGMSEAKYYVLRAVLFPKCRLRWLEMLTRAEELNERLNGLAKSQNVPIFSVPNAWYGFDPIHPRAEHMRDYWRELLAKIWRPEDQTLLRQLSWRNQWRLRTLTSPGLGQKPSLGEFSSKRTVLGDGTSISLY
jgi:hypothetical protein